MKLIILIALLFPAIAQAVDFTQRDKQSHFLMGCAVASTTAEVARELDSEHPLLWGLGAGIAEGIAFEVVAPTQSTDGREHVQDALATAIGASVCVGIIQGISIAVGKDSFSAHFDF